MFAYTGQLLRSARRRLGGFARRHKTALSIVTLLGAGSYYVYHRATTELARFEKSMREQEDTMRMMKHFNLTQNTCHLSTLALLRDMNAKLNELVDVESCVQRLKHKELTREQKKDLWNNELKFASFTRSVTAVYAVTLLYLFVRVQLNLLARRQHMERTSEGTSPPLAEAVQARFVAAHNYLLGDGLARISERVRTAVANALEQVPLHHQIQPGTLSGLVHVMREEVESDGRGYPRPLRSFVLPAEGEAAAAASAFANEHDRAELATLREELADIIDSSTVQRVATQALDAAFEVFLSCVTQANPQYFAKAIPLVNNALVVLLSTGNQANAVLDAVGELPEVTDMCHALYTAEAWPAFE